MAVTLDAAGLASAAGIDSAAATRLLPVATEHVTRYAPDAPDAVADEAVIRFAAYLAAASPTPNTSGSIGVGDLNVSTSPSTHARAFTVSGAEGLLSTWRVRRGVVA